MTVRVIDIKPHPTVVKQIVCKHCGATLEYTPHDTKTKTYTCMGDPSGDEYVECPNCSKHAVIRAW